MSKPWPEVPLADIAKSISRTIEVIPGQSYRTIGVKWWGEGAYERQTIDGSRTAAKTLSLVRQGDLIINKIWVRHGSTAIAGEDVDGCAASGEFPTFTLVENHVVPRWLHWQTRTRGFWAKCDALSRGTSGKNRIKPELFLTIPVPLPPLAEQRRVVARIEELAAQIHEARTLRHQAAEETEALTRVAFANYFAMLAKRHDIRTLGETFTFRNDLIRPTDGASGNIRFVGLQHVESHTGHRTGEDSLLAEELTGRKFKFSPGEIVYGYLRPYLNKVWIADCEGVCSVDQYVLRPCASVANGCYLAYFMRSGHFLDEAIDRTHNLMLPRLRSELLKGIKMPVPPLPEQRRIVSELHALQAEVDALKRLQAETAAELDALLPAILDRAFKGEL